MTHEPHVEAYEESDREVAGHYRAGGAWVSMIARYWTREAQRQRARAQLPHPFQGVQLLDSERNIIDRHLTRVAVARDASGIDQVSSFSLETEPGVYLVRQELAGGRIVEFALAASRGWVTQLVIRRAITDVSRDLDIRAPGGLAVLMRRPGYRTPREDKVTEAARIALAEGRNIIGEGLNDELSMLLLHKFENPIVGILGGHLLILASEQQSSAQPGQDYLSILNEVITNLRGLVGNEHPDVEALSLRCPDFKLRRSAPITMPPLFRRSWQLMVEASYQNPDLVPPYLWQRVRAAIAGTRAYLIWACDDVSRDAYEVQLKKWSSEVAALAPTEPMFGGPAQEPLTLPEFEVSERYLRIDAPAAATPPTPSLADAPEIRENALLVNVPAAAQKAIFSAEPTAEKDVSSVGKYESA